MHLKIMPTHAHSENSFLLIMRSSTTHNGITNRGQTLQSSSTPIYSAFEASSTNHQSVGKHQHTLFAYPKIPITPLFPPATNITHSIGYHVFLYG